MYEVFPVSISQEENWRDSVQNHDNEHAVYEQYQCPVSAWIHSFNELDKSTPRISRTSYGILLSANCHHMLLIC